MTEKTNVRALVLETLLAVHRDGRQSHLVIRDVLDTHVFLTEQEKAFYLRLTEGTLEYQIQLDYLIDCFSKTKTERMKPVILDILRMAVYQMKYMDSVPDSAAVNEAVRLAVRKGFSGLRGFVNGVLRSVSRHLSEVQYPDQKEEPLHYLEIRYSMPLWLVRKWVNAYGFERTERICAGFFEQRPVTVRVRETAARAENPGTGEKREPFAVGEPDRTGLSPADGYPSRRQPEQKAKKGGSGIWEHLKKAPYAPDAYYISHVGDISRLPEFRSGALLVQDVSSNLAVRMAGIREGDFVLDLCAAPGGKTILASDLTGPEGRVLSCDISAARAEQIRENILRCHCLNVTVSVRDASVPDPELSGKADVVLADVPCTGYGVIGRKPDIRYRASEENQKELVVLQRKIAAQAAVCLKPGGRLLFSTCTFGREENEDTAVWLEEEFGMKPVDFSVRLPEDLKRDLPEAVDTARKGMLQLFPGICRCDGFFFAVLEKPAD